MSNEDQTVDIESLLKSLSIEEQVSLLSAADWWRTPKIQRDGVSIPHIKMSDGPNGARGESYVSGVTTACFPCSTCIGATFDVDAAYSLGAEIADETIQKSASVLLAPTLNVIRSPLGGRNFETYSEDPHVLGTLAAAFVNGCQSRKIAATPKHFVANETEKRRTKLTAEIDEQSLREIYLLPFQLVLKNSDPWCMMTSYNRVNGEYVSESHRLIDSVLRKEWGFPGLVISDWMGTYSIAKSLNAGMDLEMPGPSRWRGEKLVREMSSGRVSKATIEESARRVLTLAKKLGRFSDMGEPPEKSVENPKRDEFITRVAAEGAVLLKNRNNILPLPGKSKVAVLGYHATNPTIGGGGSAKVLPQHIITPLSAFQDKGLVCDYHPGVPVFGAVPLPRESILRGEKNINEPLVKVEWFNGSQIGKNKVFTQDLTVPEYMIKEAWPNYLDQEYCTRISFSLRPETSGNHLFSIITTGTAKVFINDEMVYHRKQEQTLQPESFYFYKAKLEHRFQVEMNQGLTYNIRLESWGADREVLDRVDGTVFQGTSLRFFEHIDVPAAIAEAVRVAKEVGLAIICVGNTNEIESEGYDRDTMDLTAEQYKLICAIAEQNVKTVVVSFSGSPITLSPFLDKVDALLQVWFPGQECGSSIARVLLGEINPSGRLPMSWPRSNEDNPAFRNFPCDDNDVIRYEENLDIGYRYYDRSTSPAVDFPFGFGLSYTSFAISNLEADRESLHLQNDKEVELSCVVKNTGSCFGKVVVQVYISYTGFHEVAGHARPVKELKAYSKVGLEAHQSQTIQFALDKYAFSIYNVEKGCWQADAGVYCAQVGLSSRDICERCNISVIQSYDWKGI